MDDREAIREVVSRFSLAFDDGDWSGLRACLVDQITVDYGDLRGEPPRGSAADEYVAARNEGLAGLQTLHAATNHVVTVDGDQAECVCSALIQRSASDCDAGAGPPARRPSW